MAPLECQAQNSRCIFPAKRRADLWKNRPKASRGAGREQICNWLCTLSTAFSTGRCFRKFGHSRVWSGEIHRFLNFFAIFPSSSLIYITTFSQIMNEYSHFPKMQGRPAWSAYCTAGAPGHTAFIIFYWGKIMVLYAPYLRKNGCFFRFA